MTQKYTQLLPVKAVYGECSIEECDALLADSILLQEYIHADSIRSALSRTYSVPSNAVVEATLEKCFDRLGLMLQH